MKIKGGKNSSFSNYSRSYQNKLIDQAWDLYVKNYESLQDLKTYTPRADESDQLVSKSYEEVRRDYVRARNINTKKGYTKETVDKFRISFYEELTPLKDYETFKSKITNDRIKQFKRLYGAPRGMTERDWEAFFRSSYYRENLDKYEAVFKYNQERMREYEEKRSKGQRPSKSSVQRDLLNEWWKKNKTTTL